MGTVWLNLNKYSFRVEFTAELCFIFTSIRVNIYLLVYCLLICLYIWTKTLVRNCLAVNFKIISTSKSLTKHVVIIFWALPALAAPATTGRQFHFCDIVFFSLDTDSCINDCISWTAMTCSHHREDGSSVFKSPIEQNTKIHIKL